MRLAILGIRGIPANYGGFETFAEELAPRLAERGHDVTVYGRSNALSWHGSHYRGVRLVVLPTIATKHLDTPVHTQLACLHAISQRYEVVLVCNAANALFTGALRLAGVPVVLNVDGIERLRKKWGRVGRGWYQMSEYLATKIPTAIVADAGVIQDYYRERWHKASVMIPYGASTERPCGASALEPYGLQPRGYILVVARLEPENNVDLVVRAFSRVNTDLRLVVVGDAPYASEYKQRLVQLAARDPRVITTGFLYGTAYRELQSNAYAYVQAASVGGTSPALLEGMALCGCVVANGTVQNLEVMGGEGRAFELDSEESLVERLQQLADSPEEADSCRAGARARVEAVYSWEAVTDAYEGLFCSVARCEHGPA